MAIFVSRDCGLFCAVVDEVSEKCRGSNPGHAAPAHCTPAVHATRPFRPPFFHCCRCTIISMTMRPPERPKTPSSPSIRTCSFSCGNNHPAGRSHGSDLKIPTRGPTRSHRNRSRFSQKCSSFSLRTQSGPIEKAILDRRTDRHVKRVIWTF